MKETDVASRLFTLLRRMDAEATTCNEEGVARGLCDYGRHARADLFRPQNEVEWSRRLAELLNEDGVPTVTELNYPGERDSGKRSRKRLDLRLELTPGQFMAVEVKGAWSDYWGRRNKIYRSYLLHPLLPNLDATKTHTVPFDLQKLATLRAPEAAFVGQLLVGFERPDDPMDDDVENLERLAGLSAWRRSSDSWEAACVPCQRVRCWFWFRPADGSWRLPLPDRDTA